MPEQSANNSRRLRSVGRAFAVGWALLALAGVCWTLAGMTLDRSGGSDAAARNQAALWPYWIACAAGWLGLTALWRTLAARDAAQTFARFAITAAFIVFVAIAARTVVLFTHEPTLSDDIYRYIFDGRNLARGINPYLTDPAVRLADIDAGAGRNWPGERDVLKLLAFRDITTPYLPLSEYVYGSLGKACDALELAEPDDCARVFRIAFTAVEVVLMLTLLLVLRRHGLSAWWLALYAWHPLPLSEIAGSGHQDIIGATLMVIALAMATRIAPQEGDRRLRIGWAAPLAAAVLVKPVAGLAGLMALRRQRLPVWIGSIVIGVIVWFILAMPLRWLPGQPAFAEWKTTADWMTEKAAHFGGVYEPVLMVVRHAMPDGPQRQPGFNLKQEWTARRICLAIFGIAAIITWLRSRDPWRASAAALLALTLCSTTCFPWYLLWGFALFAAGGAAGWSMWVYSLTITWGYAVFITGRGHGLGVEWTLDPRVLAAAYLPAAIALVIDARASMTRALSRKRLTSDL